jgi:hypothetical protein
MPEYRVVWEIDLDANTPERAAAEALRTQRDGDSTATCFLVRTKDEKGEVVSLAEVDVADGTSRPVPPGEGERLRRVCRDLVETVNATGGVFRDRKGYVRPHGDPDWIDLGETYNLACKALGVEPQLRDPDEDE